MGKIISADTIYATAYLTDRGRQYLFNKDNTRFNAQGDDLLEFKYFTLSDTDTNYNMAARLESGDVPDISGKSENCIKASANYIQNSLLYYQIDILTFINPKYLTNADDNILRLDIYDLTEFPLAQPTDFPTEITAVGGGATFQEKTQ